MRKNSFIEINLKKYFIEFLYFWHSFCYFLVANNFCVGIERLCDFDSAFSIFFLVSLSVDILCVQFWQHFCNNMPSNLISTYSIKILNIFYKCNHSSSMSKPFEARAKSCGCRFLLYLFLILMNSDLNRLYK